MQDVISQYLWAVSQTCMRTLFFLITTDLMRNPILSIKLCLNLAIFFDYASSLMHVDILVLTNHAIINGICHDPELASLDGTVTVIG